MKTILIIVLVVFTGLLTSCVKDYECVCYKDAEEQYRYSITDQYDKGAEEQCEEKEMTLGGSYNCIVAE